MPNRIDRNANGLARLRRNMQRIAQGAVSSTLTNTVNVVAPLTGGGPIKNNPTIKIVQAGSTTSGYLSSTDWNAFHNAALSTGSYLSTATQVSTAAPLAGGGYLSTGLLISIPQASSTVSGYLSSTDWTTFNNKGSGSGSASTSISTVAPLAGGGPVSTNLTLSMTEATASTNGWLSSTDWNTFNGKQSAGNYLAGSTALATTAPLTGGGNLSTGLTLGIPQATSTANGYLGSTNWTTFNHKSDVLYAATADSNSITNTTVETAFTSSTVFAANSLHVGQMIRVTGELLFEAVSGSSNFTLRFYLNFAGGGTKVQIAGTPAETLLAFASPVVPYPFNLIFVVRSIGASGSLQPGGLAYLPLAAGNSFFFLGGAPITVDTTVANNFQITGQWATANAGNLIKLDILTVETLN